MCHMWAVVRWRFRFRFRGRLEAGSGHIVMTQHPPSAEDREVMVLLGPPHTLKGALKQVDARLLAVGT